LPYLNAHNQVGNYGVEYYGTRKSTKMKPRACNRGDFNETFNSDSLSSQFPNQGKYSKTVSLRKSYAFDVPEKFEYKLSAKVDFLYTSVKLTFSLFN